MIKKDFYDQADLFLQKLFAQVKVHKLVLQNHWSIDHLCFRVQSAESYLQFKSDFASFADMLIESEVNGRMIATFKLREPIQFQDYTIDVVELPAPKPGKYTPEGFEHVEVVADQSLTSLKHQLSDKTLDVGGLKKLFNQELEVEMQDCALKFHALSLESVIALEKNQKAHKALMGSKVLEVLKTYTPLVAGTFPLGLDIEGSDLDILITASDFATLENLLVTSFGGTPGFSISETEVAGAKTLISQFEYEGVPFEIFAQATESNRQVAYLHFQVEEKLLKLGGSVFRNKVRSLRLQGLKTEKAFAEVLQLPGDPFAEILKLQTWSEPELLKLLRSVL